MIIHDCIQGTPEWKALRIGIPTASKIERVLSDGTKRSRDKVDDFANQVAAERVLKKEIVKFRGNYYTERGKELEPEAVKLYEMQFDVDCRHVGFITNDNNTMGCSPDAIIGEDKGLELKCPEADTHVGYLCEGVLPDEYKYQVQSSLFATGFKSWDFMSYYPELPPLIVPVFPDIEFHKKLDQALQDFEILVQFKIKKIKGE